MNATRRAVSLAGIPLRRHNLIFTEVSFAAEPFFDEINLKDISSS
jgi:hypothetical protein